MEIEGRERTAEYENIQCPPQQQPYYLRIIRLTNDDAELTRIG